MDYAKANEELKNKTVTWKPVPGTYDVEIQAEPEQTEFVSESGDKTEQIKLDIKVAGEDHVWFVGKGKTYSSTYGQLMVIGKNIGKLTGEKIKVIVKQSKNMDGTIRNDYTLPEAQDLIAKQQA